MYGISPADGGSGGNRIKGPGVYNEPGVAQMGGRTPFRLAEVCGNLRDVDEVEQRKMCEKYCRTLSHVFFFSLSDENLHEVGDEREVFRGAEGVSVPGRDLAVSKPDQR